MKRIFTLLVLVFTILSVKAQLTIQPVEEYAHYKTVYTVTYLGGYMGEIRFVENFGYYMMGATSNQFEDKMHTMFLGETKESAIQSIKDLKTFVDSTDKGTFVVPGFRTTSKLIITPTLGTKIIQLQSEGVAGISGIPSWFYQKDKHFNGVIEAISTFIEE